MTGMHRGPGGPGGKVDIYHYMEKIPIEEIRFSIYSQWAFRMVFGSIYE